MTISPRDFSAPMFLPVPSSPHLATWAVWLACLVSVASADEVQLLQRKPDPYGYPRPSAGETNVPTGTSFFFQLGFQDKNTTDTVDRGFGNRSPRTYGRARRGRAPAGTTVRRRVLGQGLSERQPAPGAGGLHRQPGRTAAGDELRRDGQRPLETGRRLAGGKGFVAIHDRRGGGHARGAVSARLVRRARPLARRLFHRVLQAEFLYQRRQPYPGLRVDGPRPAAAATTGSQRWPKTTARPKTTPPLPADEGLESAAGLLDDGHGAPAGVHHRGTAQRGPGTRNAAHHGDRETRRRSPAARRRFLRARAIRHRFRPAAGGRLSSGRRGPDRRRRKPRAGQGRGGRRRREGIPQPAGHLVPGTRQPLEDRLRQAVAQGGRPQRTRFVPARRLLPAQVPPGRNAALLLGQGGQGMGHRPPPLRPPPGGQLCRLRRATWRSTARIGRTPRTTPNITRSCAPTRRT